MIIKNHGRVIGEITPTSEGIWYRSSINSKEWGFARNRAEAKGILIDIANS
jgi:hypothetical protein